MRSVEALKSEPLSQVLLRFRELRGGQLSHVIAQEDASSHLKNNNHYNTEEPCAFGFILIVCHLFLCEVVCYTNICNIGHLCAHERGRFKHLIMRK